MCDAGYWVDNLRHTVRFAAAVQAALEDGYRVFAELAPHPLLTHAVEQTARSLDMSVAALAGMRREQPLPHGLRGLLTDLHSAGAAVDFSVLYPAGRLVDAPLPAWTHRPLVPRPRRPDQQTQGGCTVAVHPLLGSHVRLTEEPERHVWQATSAPRYCPGWAITRSITWPRFRGPPTARWRWPRPARSSARRPRSATSAFEQMLLLDDQTPIDAVASVEAPGVVDFVVATHQDGENTRHATAALHATEDDPPPAYDMAALLAAHPCLVNGTELRESLDERGVQLRSCIHRSGRRAHCGHGTSAPCWPRSGCLVRSASSRPPTACTPRCWMPVSSPSPLTPASRPAAVAACCCRWVCAGYVPTVLPATPATATRE